MRLTSLVRRACGTLAAGAAVSLSAISTQVHATEVVFSTDPFLGSTALTTPGRQVFAGQERFLSGFNLASDSFVFNAATFGLGNSLSFVNSLSGGIPAAGADVIVLQDTDNDGNPATPFAAGTAASVIAGKVSTDHAGFFIYHNSVLDVNRLVFSTNLNDPAADLSILARITSPTGLDAINALPQFTNANFVSSVPEPSTAALAAIGLAGVMLMRRRSKMAEPAA
ncbi:PEP-CTERM sorting domain-containing protein [Piscinibacter terrae]|uniref:PEP-CTERM sorting domain-containing protein n=1 Tax=Piscinibacter terrae TaxID=2496871 RepID=A0A3N7HRM8_9BURK|nr:PEP-CTERM sorting domain-containing protein [Albitalea terrae]RQP24393.1 PEP-CTERM sorting domain-containing protein [Albitalea terrae]